MSADDNMVGPNETGRSSSFRRRTVIGAAAWSVPVVAVVGTTPAFGVGMSGGLALTKDSPTADFSADQTSVPQELRVLLTNNGAAVTTPTNIIFSATGNSGEPVTWLTFNPTSAATNGNGIATTLLTYGTPKPAAGTVFTVVATVAGSSPAISTMWQLTYTPFPSLFVARVGDGATSPTLSGTSVAAFVDEFKFDGTAGRTFALPTAASAPNKRFVSSGSATSDGELFRSTDGKFVSLGGYDANTGVSGVVANSTSRTVAKIDRFGVIDTSLSINDGFTANNIRGVASDGTNIWASGNGSPASSGGTRYVVSTGSTTQLSSTPTNVRQIGVFGGQLYVSSGSSPFVGISKVGTGSPTTAGQTTTLVASNAASTNPYGFVLFDRSNSVAGFDSLYVADESAGLVKYAYDGTAWVFKNAFAGGIRQLTGVVAADNGSVTLYATTTTATGNALVRIVDTGLYDANISAVSTILATAAPNTAFRGVSFAPS